MTASSEMGKEDKMAHQDKELGPPCLAGVTSLSKVQAGGEEDEEVEKTKNRCQCVQKCVLLFCV